MADDAFAAKFEELRCSFRAGLPERLAEIGRLAALGDAGLPALRALAHKLAGQGGTFGEPAISDAATMVEDAAPDQLPAAIAALAAAVQEAS